MSLIEIITNNQEETEQLAAFIGSKLASPSLILLDGPMSGGKTQFSKAFAKGYGSLDDTSSPTYTIVNQYDSPQGKIYHLDLYRISDYDELFSIGLDDLLKEDAIMLIEWPEIAELDNQADLIIKLEILDNNKRKFTFEGKEDVINLIRSFK